MTDEEILDVWDHVNHDQSVTDQLIEFAQAVEYCVYAKIKMALKEREDAKCTTPPDSSPK